MTKGNGRDVIGSYMQESFYFTTIGHPNPLPHNVTLKVMTRIYAGLPAVLFGQVSENSLVPCVRDI